MTTYKFQLQYFKPSGKYYSSSDLEVEMECEPPMYIVAEIVRGKIYAGQLPGLIEDHSAFHVLITGEGHSMGFPILILAKG